jgi:DHA1 family multidrug resistance protein-like MFS transporter
MPILPTQLLPYPEELPDFIIPEKYTAGASSSSAGDHSPAATLVNQSNPNNAGNGLKMQEKAPEGTNTEARTVIAPVEANAGLEQGSMPVKSFSMMPEEEKKKLIPPGTILVEWYDDKDSAHPFNWSGGKHAVVAFLIL